MDGPPQHAHCKVGRIRIVPAKQTRDSSCGCGSGPLIRDVSKRRSADPHGGGTKRKRRRGRVAMAKAG